MSGSDPRSHVNRGGHAAAIGETVCDRIRHLEQWVTQKAKTISPWHLPDYLTAIRSGSCARIQERRGFASFVCY